MGRRRRNDGGMPSQGCQGHGCRYRQLYQDAQFSLADLVRQHAAAIEHHGRLRAGLLAAMKRCRPDAVAAAERATGSALADADDTALLTHLEGMLTSGRTLSGIDDLRRELHTRGVTLPAQDNLAVWAAHLRTTGPPPRPDFAVSEGAGVPAQGRTSGPAAVPFGPAAGQRPTSAAANAPPAPADEFPPPPEPSEGAQPAPHRPGSSGGRSAPAAAHTGGLPPAPWDPPRPAAVAPSASTVGASVDVSDPSVRVRPTLGGTPQRRAAPRGRPVKVRAAGPADDAVGGEVDAAVGRLLEGDGPVFVSDVAGEIGAEAAAVWERRLRDDAGSAAVRFIGPPRRHRMRGSLVVPVERIAEDPPFASSVWGRCAADLRGRVLYEVAVLLRHYNDAPIYGFQLGPHTLSFRAERPTSGIVGVVVALHGDLVVGGDACASLIGEVDTLLGEPLVSVSVLAVAERHRDPLIDLIGDAAAQRGWTPRMPLLAAAVWDHAAGDGGVVVEIASGGGR